MKWLCKSLQLCYKLSLKTIIIVGLELNLAYVAFEEVEYKTAIITRCRVR